MPENTLAVRDLEMRPPKEGKGVGTRSTKDAPDRPPLPAGWLTSDDDEICLRRWRGQTEILSVNALETSQPCLGTFCVQSTIGVN